jgi:hypothetical protein
MISVRLTATNKMLSNGILCVSEPDTVVIPQAEPGEIPFCYCEYECDYIQLVLAGTDEYETIELTDDTYGTYFELGTMAQASKAGYLVDWGKVATEISKYGLYTFRLVSNFFGTDIEKETHQYYLQPYSPTVADGTVRIETIRNGCIEGGVDYSGLNWKTQIRLKGKITGEREIETESYVNTSREEKQIQDKVINKYTLTTKGIQSIVFDDLMEDGFMANVIKLTDYTIFSYRNIRDV